jgi:hypothetical protein
MSKQKTGLRKLGNVVAIPLGDGTFAYGRVLREPLFAFYDLRTDQLAEACEVVRAPVAFTIWVMRRALTHGDWTVIGNVPIEEKMLKAPLFFKEDPLSGALRIYDGDTGEESAATRENCNQLERAAVWSRNHVVDRLVDHFHGRPCKWGGKGR